MYNYVVTAHKPSSVISATRGSISSPDETNLVLNKFSRIEIYTLVPGGLKSFKDVPVYGRIAAMQVYRPRGRDTDLLFVATEQQQYFVISYDEKQHQLITETKGNMELRVGQVSHTGMMSALDPHSVPNTFPIRRELRNAPAGNLKFAPGPLFKEDLDETTEFLIAVPKDGSLRIIRNGVGITEQAVMEMPGITGVWSLRPYYDSPLEEGEELQEVDEYAGFDMSQSTIATRNVVGNLLVQVTQYQVRLIDLENRRLISQWDPPHNSKITVADINPKSSSIVAVGLWTVVGVQVLRLPSLEIIADQPLEGVSMTRSVLLSTFENNHYLLAALGDGQLFHFILDPTTGRLSERKQLSLGTQPVMLTSFTSNGLNVHSLTSIKFDMKEDSPEYYVVGTSFTIQGETNASKGRILVFQVTVFEWKASEDGSAELIPLCCNKDFSLALRVVSRGHFVLVGDLFRSISLLAYKESDKDNKSLEVIAKDNNPHWISSVEAFDDDEFIASDTNYDLITFRKNDDTADEDERRKLETNGFFHLGDSVNQIRHGSLAMNVSETEPVGISSELLYCTSSGAIGVIASIPEQKFKFLKKLEESIDKVIGSIGDLRFIDGDLIESFLDRSRSEMVQIAEECEMKVDELLKIVE
ncbi:17871_t:CDS:10, partial [Racocetra fulgida]